MQLNKVPRVRTYTLQGGHASSFPEMSQHGPSPSRARWGRSGRSPWSPPRPNWRCPLRAGSPLTHRPRRRSAAAFGCVSLATTLRTPRAASRAQSANRERGEGRVGRFRRREANPRPPLVWGRGRGVLTRMAWLPPSPLPLRLVNADANHELVPAGCRSRKQR